MIADPGQRQDVAAQHPAVVQRLRKAYEEWFADVTQVPIERPPIPVGHREWPAVELPAPEAYLTGNDPLVQPVRLRARLADRLGESGRHGVLGGTSGQRRHVLGDGHVRLSAGCGGNATVR